MLKILCEEFVVDDLREDAYDDCHLPIDISQTISQPFTVVFQCEALKLEGGERVLEIGTGSGYAAAVLSQLANQVYTVERIPDRACPPGLRQRARLCRQRNVGLSDNAPFDGIWSPRAPLYSRARMRSNWPRVGGS
jgi:protein-L-isoaspartate(D-aspartate) O-methyltransferase